MTTSPPNQAPKRRRPIALALVVALCLMVLAALCRVKQDYYGVWTMTGPGLSITVLPDIRIGPVLWLYLGGANPGNKKTALKTRRFFVAGIGGVVSKPSAQLQAEL